MMKTLPLSARASVSCLVTLLSLACVPAHAQALADDSMTDSFSSAGTVDGPLRPRRQRNRLRLQGRPGGFSSRSRYFAGGRFSSSGDSFSSFGYGDGSADDATVVTGYQSDQFSTDPGADEIAYDRYSDVRNDPFSSGIPSPKQLDIGCTWERGRMPLRVYFSTAMEYARDGQLRSIIKSSLNEWTAGSNGKLSYVITPDFKMADIIFCEEYTSDHEWAESLTDFHRGHLNRVKIRFIDSAMKPSKLPEPKLRAICLHEIGHALGLTGHSNNPLDAMSTAAVNDEHPVTAVTSADRYRLFALYSSTRPDSYFPGLLSNHLSMSR